MHGVGVSIDLEHPPLQCRHDQQERDELRYRLVVGEALHASRHQTDRRMRPVRRVERRRRPEVVARFGPAGFAAAEASTEKQRELRRGGRLERPRRRVETARVAAPAESLVEIVRGRPRRQASSGRREDAADARPVARPARLATLGPGGSFATGPPSPW